MISKRFVVLILGVIIFSPLLQAQVLTKTISRFDSLRNLTYKMTVKEKPPMSEEVSKDSLTANFAFYNSQELFNVVGQTTQEVYDGTKLVKIDLNSHTYSINKGITGSMVQHRMLPYLVSRLKQDLVKNVPVRMEKDSVINDIKYFHLTITSRDTIMKGKRVFLIKKLLIDKISYLPIYYKSEQQGFVDGTDIFVNTYEEMHFYDYDLDGENFSIISEFKTPPDFVIETLQNRKASLTKGSEAPELNLTDIAGNIFQLKKQKGKVVLLNFMTNSCFHSAEAISMLNNLYSKYEKKNFSIVTINPYDNKEAIEKYNKIRNVKYPIYISSGLHDIDSYHVYDFPTFYLVDKNRKVIQAFGGYSDATEKQLDNLIRQHL